MKRLFILLLALGITYESFAIFSTWEAGPREYRIRKGAKIIFEQVSPDAPPLWELVKVLVDKKI